MRRLFVLFVAALLPASFVFAENYTVDTATAEIKWNASKITGKHNGRVGFKSGVIEMTDEKLSGGEVAIDMGTIVVDDIKDPGSNAKLTGHLKNPDFFDVEKHPIATLKITDVKPGDGESWYEVTADLTIKDITKSVSFPAEVKQAPEGVTVNTKLTIDRTEYDIRYGSGKFFENLGDKAIHDKFDIEVFGTAK